MTTAAVPAPSTDNLRPWAVSPERLRYLVREHPSCFNLLGFVPTVAAAAERTDNGRVLRLSILDAERLEAAYGPTDL